MKSEEVEIFILFVLIGLLAAIYLTFSFLPGLIISILVLGVMFYISVKNTNEDLVKVFANVFVVIVFSFIFSVGVRLLDFIGIVDLYGSSKSKSGDYKSCVSKSIYLYNDGGKALRDCKKYK